MIQFLGKDKSTCYLTQEFQFRELILRRKKGTRKCIYVNVHDHIVHNKEKKQSKFTTYVIWLNKFGYVTHKIEKNYVKAK